MKKLSCHCKGVEIEVNISEPLNKIIKCNCSLCERRGAAMTMVGPDDFNIIKGEKLLRLYQYHTNVAKHYFCSNCGIYTHHNPRMNPKMFVINLGCLDGVDSLNLKNIIINDGINHPLDKK